MRHEKLILPALLILVLILGLYLGQFTSKKTPEIQASAPHELDIQIENPVDLGTLWAGELVSRNVPIWNRADNDVEVTVLATSCGCTEARLDPSHLEPGASAVLQLTLDTTKKSGAFTESIKLGVTATTAEDASHSHLYTVEFEGKINGQRGLSTLELSFGKVRRGMGPVALEFDIVADVPSRFALDALTQSIETPALEVKLWPGSQQDNSALWHGTVILDPNKAIQGTKTLDTAVLIPLFDASDSLRTLKLRVRGTLGYMVDCSPQMLYWPASDRNAPRTLKFTSATGNSVRIVDVEASSTPFLTFDVKDNDSPTPTLEVKCGLEEGHAVVRTDIYVTIEYGPDKLQQRIPIAVLVL